MSIKSQLVQLLAHLPKTQTVPERRAILTITGFEHLAVKIDSFEKNNFVFFSELVEVIFSEGQAQSLEFFTELADSGLVGLEAKNKLSSLIERIAVLDSQQRKDECKVTLPNSPKTYRDTSLEFSTRPQFTRQSENRSTLSTSNHYAEELKGQEESKLVIPSLSGTQTFEFTTVMVDIQGKEISRRQRQAYYLTEDLGTGMTLEMVYIPEGTFLMGSPEFEGKRYTNERPQHSVTIKPFLISKYPITQAQWREVASWAEIRQRLKLRPSRSGGRSHPVTQVSWHDTIEFCDRLSQKTGHEYRLPSEAEWEYACRAGTTTPFHFGETITSNLANYDARQSYRSKHQGIYREATTPVGSFQVANPFGLFDMHGNVWEWCLDHWHENYDNAPTKGDEWLDSSENQTRVMRGGSLLNDLSMCRSSSRLYKNASGTFKHVGFRIVFSI
jgi:formylglycine-generating enzyme required for sulfatase activity